MGGGEGKRFAQEILRCAGAFVDADVIGNPSGVDVVVLDLDLLSVKPGFPKWIGRDGMILVQSDDGRLKLRFHGAKIMSDAGLVVFRKLDEAFRLTENASAALSDPRHGKNTQHTSLAMLRLNGTESSLPRRRRQNCADGAATQVRIAPRAVISLESSGSF